MKLSTRVARWLARAAQLPLPAYSSQGGFLTQLNLHNLDLKPIATKREQLDAYVGWVYACVSTIAQDLRTNPWAVWKKAGKRREDWEELDESKFPQVFRMPNTIDKTWGQLVERRNLHKDTTGEAYWHLITNRPGGPILGVEMIQPDHIDEPILDAQNQSIAAWKVTIPDRGPQPPIDARDLILDFYPSPKDPLRGASPIEAFALSHHLDLYLRAYGVKMLKDGGMISQYITTEQELTEEQALALEERLTRKGRTPARIFVFGKGATAEMPGLPLKDLQLLASLKPSREQILAIYKMPASKMGIVEDSNRANMAAASKNYEENALLPRLLTLDQIVNSLLPRMGLDPAKFAYESESPVEDDRDQIFNEALKELQSGAIKVNQFHQRVGNEDQGDEGEVYFIPSTVKVVRSLAETADTPEPEPTVEPVAEPDALDDAARAIAQAATPLFSDTTNEIRRLQRALAEERWLRAQDHLEAKAKSKIRAQFSRDLKTIRDALKDNFQPGQARDVKWIWPEGLRDWIDDAVNAGSDDWKVLIETILVESIETGWELFKSEVAGGLAFNMFEQQAVEYARRLAAEHIAEIDQTTIEAVRQLIAKGIENGSTINEMSRALSELYDGFKGVRAETIARTETATSMGWGKYQAAQQSATRLGMTLERTWRAVNDGRTRHSHSEADGQTIGMNETYSVGGFALRFPGDPNAPASEIINCRCLETFRDVSD